jgi:hypothetical protein
MLERGVFEGVKRLAVRLSAPGDIPDVIELLGRPDAKATVERLRDVVAPEAPDPELVVTLTALAVLRSRAAFERRSPP